MVEHGIMVLLQEKGNGINAVGPTRTFSSWDETGDSRSGSLQRKVVFHPTTPPRDGIAVAHYSLAVNLKHSGSAYVSRNHRMRNNGGSGESAGSL